MWYGMFVNLRSSSEFIKACQDQGIKINRLVIGALRRGHSKQYPSYEPTNILAGVAEAGRFLRTSPNRGLASGKVASSELLEGDSASRSLANILNASIERIEPEPTMP